MAVLTNGYNVVINKRTGTTNKPLYPFTRFENVFNTAGEDLQYVLTTYYEPKGNGHYVPDYSGETTSNLRFLRNDNTWANIQEASTSQAGVVQLNDTVTSTSTTQAATANAVKTAKDAVDTLATTAEATYAKSAWIGEPTNTTTGVKGIAPLDTSGMVPTSFLPSYVSDVFEVRLEAVNPGDPYTKAYDKNGTEITPKANAIYVYCIGDAKDNNTYRWSGTQFAEISKSLVIGTTTGTAFDGGLGNAMYTWYQDPTAHARVDATKTEASQTNGYIKIDGVETLVYTHPGTGTNPHGTTASDLGLGNVENKSSATIRSELTTTDVRTALGLDVTGTAATAVYATSTVDGIMSKEYAAKLDGCEEISVSTTAPTFASGSGIWYEIKSEDS